MLEHKAQSCFTSTTGTTTPTAATIVLLFTINTVAKLLIQDRETWFQSPLTDDQYEGVYEVTCSLQTENVNKQLRFQTAVDLYVDE